MKIMISFNDQERDKFNEYVQTATGIEDVKIDNKYRRFIGKFGELKCDTNEIVYDLKSEMINELMDLVISALNAIKPFVMGYMKLIEKWFSDTKLLTDEAEVPFDGAKAE